MISGALIAGLACAVTLVPVARLHYSAWRYRRQLQVDDPWECKHSPTSAADLKQVVRGLATRRASPQLVRRLLGAPHYFARTEDGRLVYFYDTEPMRSRRVHSDMSRDQGVVLTFHGDALVTSECCDLLVATPTAHSTPAEEGDWWWLRISLYVPRQGQSTPVLTWCQPRWLSGDPDGIYDRPSWVARAAGDAPVL